MAKRFPTWFYAVFGPEPGKPATNDVMLDYFVSTLDVRVTGLEASIETAADQAVIKNVRSSLTGFYAKYQPSAALLNESAWNEAYRLERTLALVERADRLWPELNRRIAEATEEKLSAAPRLAAAADIAGQLAFDKSTPPVLNPDSIPILRALLLGTLEKLHWASQRKFYSRAIRNSATKRIVFCGMAAFFGFVLPYLLIYRQLWLGQTDPIGKWAWLPFYSILTAGLLGALFSRLIYLQQNWNALSVGGLKDARDYSSFLLRGCVGMTGAVIISFFLQSKVIGGSLFPDFGSIGLARISQTE